MYHSSHVEGQANMSSKASQEGSTFVRTVGPTEEESADEKHLVPLRIVLPLC